MLPLSGEMRQIMNRAEELATAEGAPSVRLDHFLAAKVLGDYRAEDVIKVIERWGKEWRGANA